MKFRKGEYLVTVWTRGQMYSGQKRGGSIRRELKLNIGEVK
jgi:hypothetical protein